MLSGGQGLEARAHIAQVAARREGGPSFRGRVFQTTFAVVGVIWPRNGPVAIDKDKDPGRLSRLPPPGLSQQGSW